MTEATQTQINNASLELLLITMPEEKAKYMGIIIDAIIEKKHVEKQIKEIQKKETLNELEEPLLSLTLKIEHNYINYQKSHDLLQAYIAIANMRGIIEVA